MSRILLDNSTLSAFAKCPSYAMLRYHLGYTSAEESAALKAGTACHEALALYLGGKDTITCLDKLYDEYAAWSREHVPPGDRLEYENIEAILGHWMQTHPQAELPYKAHPDFIEVGFCQPLSEDEDIWLTGRLDAAVQDWGSTNWYVLDHKTTGRMDQNWVRRYRRDSQMTGYIWALRQAIPDEPVVGAYVNGIELKKLPSDTKRKCREHGVVYAECGHLHGNSEIFLVERTPEEIDEWQATALILAREYTKLAQQIETVEDLHKARTVGMFNGSCSWCESENFCTSGRKPELVPIMFRHEPWQPWALEEIV